MSSLSSSYMSSSLSSASSSSLQGSFWVWAKPNKKRRYYWSSPYPEWSLHHYQHRSRYLHRHHQYNWLHCSMLFYITLFVNILINACRHPYHVLTGMRRCDAVFGVIMTLLVRYVHNRSVPILCFSALMWPACVPTYTYHDCKSKKKYATE